MMEFVYINNYENLGSYKLITIFFIEGKSNHNQNDNGAEYDSKGD